MDVVVLAMLKKYVNETLVGMGALKGAPCEVDDIVNADGTHTITFKWEDTEGVSHTASITVKDGKDGTNGTDGVGIVSIEKTGTQGLVDTYTITLTNGDTYTFTVTNGSGSGGATALVDLTDVNFTELDDEQMIFYNETTEKFENVDAGAVSETAYAAIASLLS